MKARVPNSLLKCSPEMQTEETIPLISLHKSMMLRLAYSPERQALCQRQDAAYQDGTISEIWALMHLLSKFKKWCRRKLKP